MPPLLQLASLHKRFGQVVIADGLDLEVEQGAAVGIVGPNGAGKTSLFGLISGDLRPDRGEIRLDGRVINHEDAARRCRQGIGRTYQVPRPFSGLTVFENVLLAAQQGARARAPRCYELAYVTLERTKLAEEANRPAGSLGLLARKRLELARALASEPRVLLLDEVAGGLTDPEVRELVEIVAAARQNGIAIVWIEHVVRALLATVDRLICLAGGHIIGDGEPRAVLSSPAVREVYLGTALASEVGA
jgi:branched-chain amino acid transport system ATP-binding protein